MLGDVLMMELMVWCQIELEMEVKLAMGREIELTTASTCLVKYKYCYRVKRVKCWHKTLQIAY